MFAFAAGIQSYLPFSSQLCPYFLAFFASWRFQRLRFLLGRPYQHLIDRNVARLRNKVNYGPRNVF